MEEDKRSFRYKQITDDELIRRYRRLGEKIFYAETELNHEEAWELYCIWEELMERGYTFKEKGWVRSRKNPK